MAGRLRAFCHSPVLSPGVYNHSFMLHPTQSLRFLLGDPQRQSDITIARWKDELEVEYARVIENDSSWQTGVMNNFFQIIFESACALMHDARLSPARERFLYLLRYYRDPGPSKVLARLGYARTYTLQARYPAARGPLDKAIQDANEIGDHLLFSVGQIFRIINESDGGLDRQDAGSWLAFRIPDSVPGELLPLLEAHRVYALSRVCMRASKRQRGRDLLSEFVSSNLIGQVPAIARGMVYRMHGILHAISGFDTQARDSLEHAVAVFHNAGHALGEVQTAFSLARMNLPVNRSRMLQYLNAAAEILGESEQPGGRQMPAEHAQLRSRQADLEFARGELGRAERLYCEDLALAEELAGPGGITRGLAHAKRNVGRILVATKRPNDAAAYFRESVGLFEHLGDSYNVFLSRVLLGETYLATGARQEAKTLLAHLERMFESSDERDKERAIVAMLRARYQSRFAGEHDMALATLRPARIILERFGPDYYYLRALIAEGEILMAIGDQLSARDRLVEARGCAADLEIEDLRRHVGELLTQLEPLPMEKPRPMGLVTAAILFADIRGFTAACRQMEIDDMARFIADFARIVSQRTSLHKGTPIRFLGDCVMAVFLDGSDGRPRECHALEAACEISYHFGQHQRTAAAGQPALADVGIGFGIATGDMIAGRFGSGELNEYSVIGEAVNLASRLQGKARRNGQIILSREAAARVESYLDELSMTREKLSLDGIGEVSACSVDASEAWPVLRKKKLMKTGELTTLPPPTGRFPRA